jgi:hypothetical protein
LLLAQGDPQAARPLLERAIATFDKTFGPSHPEANEARRNVVKLLIAERRLGEACELGKMILGAQETALGQSHRWTKRSARVTADALDALGRAAEAKELRERYGIAEPDKPRPA